MSRQDLVQYLLSGLTLGSVYAMVGLSLTIVFNATGVVNFAQGELVMVAGLVAASTVASGMPLLLAAAVAIAAAALAAELAYLGTIAPIRHSTLFSLILVTLGVAIVTRTLAQLAWGTEARALPPFTGGESIDVLGASLTPQAIWVMAGTAATMLCLYLFFTRTRAGQAMLACSENREAAALVGIDTRWVAAGAFALGGALAGLAGVLITPISSAVFSVGLTYTLAGFAAAVLGGFGSAPGALVGGLVLGLLESFGGGLISSGYREVFPLVALVLVLMVRPGGIFGTRALG